MPSALRPRTSGRSLGVPGRKRARSANSELEDVRIPVGADERQHLAQLRAGGAFERQELEHGRVDAFRIT